MPLPLFDAVPGPDGPGPGIVAKEGDAAQLIVREVAVPGGREGVPLARDVTPAEAVSVQPQSVRTLQRACLACGSAFALNPRHAKEHRYCSARCRAAHYRADKQRAIPGESRPERLFARWIETPEGQAITRMVRQFALERVRAGRRRGEINYLCAKVRDETLGLGKDEQGFAVNNTIRAHLARYLMEREPELAGWFETRTLRGRP